MVLQYLAGCIYSGDSSYSVPRNQHSHFVLYMGTGMKIIEGSALKVFGVMHWHIEYHTVACDVQ